MASGRAGSAQSSCCSCGLHALVSKFHPARHTASPGFWISYMMAIAKSTSNSIASADERSRRSSSEPLCAKFSDTA